MIDVKKGVNDKLEEQKEQPLDQAFNRSLNLNENSLEGVADNNNNTPVNDSDTLIPFATATKAPLFKTTGALLLERERHSRAITTRFSRRKKKVAEKKECKKYMLEPLPRGIFGDVLQKKPNGKPKYPDVVTVIHQGTSNHKNVDTTTASRYSGPKTLEDCLGKRLYYVKPMAEGAISLEDLMKQKKGRQLFSESQAKFVCATLMLGLKFLHENDIVHGGIMPRKIVFNDKYYPQLANFNTAEILTERVSRFRERLPLEYTAPEQCYEDISEITDIFSLGVVIYEMIFGRVPHQGESNCETRRILCNNSIVPVFDSSKLSVKGQKFLCHCLKKSEKKRFNLLELKKKLFASVAWFDDLDDEKIFEQTFPSPLKAKIQTLRKEQKAEPNEANTENTEEQKSPNICTKNEI